jgi:hypothetical protein
MDGGSNSKCRFREVSHLARTGLYSRLTAHPVCISSHHPCSFSPSHRSCNYPLKRYFCVLTLLFRWPGGSAEAELKSTSPDLHKPSRKSCLMQPQPTLGSPFYNQLLFIQKSMLRNCNALWRIMPSCTDPRDQMIRDSAVRGFPELIASTEHYF